MTFAEAKAALAARLTATTGLKVQTEESASPQPPCITFVTAGFSRRALESADVAGEALLRDPLGARVIVFRLSVRIWVSVRGDATAAQREMDGYARAAMDAIDEDPSCGAVFEDSAMSLSDIRFAPQTQGQPPIIAFMDFACVWVEAMP